MLTVAHIAAGIGGTPILSDVSLTVGAGEVVALLGRNGMGKTSTVRAIMGMLPVSAGSIAMDGVALNGLAPHLIARQGLGLVPEGRQVFPTLSVRENLLAAARDGRWTLTAVYELFPRLGERAGQSAGKLSGGEQQMLAIGRALMTNPRLLILDEATEGLAPLIRQEIWRCLAALREEGLAILVIDPSLGPVTALADRVVVLEKGRTVWTGSSDALRGSPEIAARYLHV